MSLKKEPQIERRDWVGPTLTLVTPLCNKVSDPSDCLLALIKVKKSIPLLPQVSQESDFCLSHSFLLVTLRCLNERCDQVTGMLYLYYPPVFEVTK